MLRKEHTCCLATLLPIIAKIRAEQMFCDWVQDSLYEAHQSFDSAPNINYKLPVSIPSIMHGTYVLNNISWTKIP